MTYTKKHKKIDIKRRGEIFTPEHLVIDMLSLLPDNFFKDSSLKIIDTSCGSGNFLFKILEMRMKNGIGRLDALKTIYGIEIDKGNVEECQKRLAGESPSIEIIKTVEKNIVCANSLKFYHEEKYDAVVMNPPYQEQKEGFKKSQAIWPKFVFNAFDVLKESGYLVAVHPSGWRNVDGVFKDVQEALKSREMSYLEIHSVEDGLSVFGAQIRYDFYCVKNIKNNNFETTIKCQDGSIEKIDISKLNFIPNGKFKEIMSLVAKEGEEKVEVLFSRSAYETRKPHMSKTQNEEFKFPCVYSINVKEIPSFFYSNVKKEHFGISKFIVPNGDARSIGFIEDASGEYALTQFSFAIVESNKESLSSLHKLFRNKEFIKFHNTFLCNGKTQYNYRTIALFKKDFWKEFI